MNAEAGTGFLRGLYRKAVVLLAAMGIAGCAGLPSGMEEPAVTIADFGLGGGGLFEQQYNLTLRIQNPNATELNIDGIALDVEINGEHFAKVVGNQSVTVPRFGTSLVPVEAVSSLGGLLKQIGALVQADKPSFRYRIRGLLILGDGTRIPFDRRGEFDLGLAALKQPS